MSDHLTPKDFFDFIDRGGGSGPVGRHLMSGPDCLFELDFLLFCETPATPEEEAALDSRPPLELGAGEASLVGSGAVDARYRN